MTNTDLVCPLRLLNFKESKMYTSNTSLYSFELNTHTDLYIDKTGNNLYMRMKGILKSIPINDTTLDLILKAQKNA